MDQRIIDLYDSFTHGGMNRRQFLDRLGELAGSSAAAVALLPLLQNDYARAAIVPPDDARLAIDTVAYDAKGTPVSGYLARPKEKGKRPAVIVIHENRGLNPHIQDVARRIALEGFLSLAVDMLSPLGGTPADEDKARDMIGTLNAEETAHRIVTAVPFLEHHAESTGKVGGRRLLLGRRHGQPYRRAFARPEGRRRLLWRAAAGGAGEIDPGATASALCRARPAN
jgi:carboxymethylenebutenolidase